MLTNLKIENIAIIESASIDYENGFNVMSGETGAGKSIIIDALSAVLGERTSKELIRTGAEKARVVAVFENISDSAKAALRSMDLPENEDGSLLISRIISQDGRNVCKVNQNPVTVSMLKTIGKELISIHGQHDSQNLLNPEQHYKYLDALGNTDEIYNKYLAEYMSYSSLYRRYKALSQNEEEKLKRIEFLKYEINEIENAGIRPGEYDELCDRRDLYRNSEKVVSGLSDALSVLSDSDENMGAVNALLAAAKSLEKSASHYEALTSLASSVLDIAYAASDKKDEIENMIYDCEFDSAKQAETEERINTLYKLKSKYGETEEEILEYLARSKEELSELSDMSEDKEELEARLEKDKEVLLAAAERLSAARKHAASEFEVRVKHELGFLDMPSVEIHTDFKPCKLNPTGADEIEFLISPNPGESLKPLAKIASGGELSRIMLAIQTVLTGMRGNVDTMIFDEIDTGVSGSAAEKIAISLSRVSKKCQVICITHSAQVAAYADTHFLISKGVVDDKTYTSVEELNYDGRIGEIARIIGGVHVTDLQLSGAKEMLANASAAK